mgnify:CR=1 FL=1
MFLDGRRGAARYTHAPTYLDTQSARYARYAYDDSKDRRDDRAAGRPIAVLQGDDGAMALPDLTLPAAVGAPGSLEPGGKPGGNQDP